jgi:NAD-dependent dihydropyrimidine dehydrogenase PreA subunit
MEKANIRVNPAECVECIACQLICSLTYAGSFNPEKAYIVINTPSDEIHFTEECRVGCSLCTRYCDTGAITRIKEE